MAKTSLKEKQKRPGKHNGKPTKTREYTRCNICGRPKAVLKKYGICRVCFREKALAGEIPGVKKSSW